MNQRVPAGCTRNTHSSQGHIHTQPHSASQPSHICIHRTHKITFTLHSHVVSLTQPSPRPHSHYGSTHTFTYHTHIRVTLTNVLPVSHRTHQMHMHHTVPFSHHTYITHSHTRVHSHTQPSFSHTHPSRSLPWRGGTDPPVGGAAPPAQRAKAQGGGSWGPHLKALAPNITAKFYPHCVALAH